MPEEWNIIGGKATMNPPRNTRKENVKIGVEPDGQSSNNNENRKLPENKVDRQGGNPEEKKMSSTRKASEVEYHRSNSNNNDSSNDHKKKNSETGVEDEDLPNDNNRKLTGIEEV